MGHRQEIYKDGKLLKVVDTREINDEKEKLLKSVKKKVLEEMGKTDWMIIRKIERDIPIETSIQEHRFSLITKLEEIEKDLGVIDTMKKFDGYYKAGEFLSSFNKKKW